MEYFDAIRALALRSVVTEDREYRLRTIFRWYSKTFFTPLHTVDELPLEEVLRHYYESKYEGLENEELQAEINEFLETPEEKVARLRREDEEKADNESFMKHVAKNAEKKKLENLVAPLTPILSSGMMKEAEIRDIKPPPPDIKIQYVDKKILDDEMEGFGSMGPVDDNL